MREGLSIAEKLRVATEALERIANLKPMPVLDPHDTQARCRRMAQKALLAVTTDDSQET